MQTTSAPISVNANKALWEKGDFTKLAQTMRESGTALVSQLGIKKGDYVLDLGCGDGTTAIPAAHQGARVRGVDIAENLVAAGNQRVRQEGLTNITFEHGFRSACREYFILSRHIHIQFQRHTSGICNVIQNVLWSNDECV